MNLQEEVIATLGAIGQTLPDASVALMVVDLKPYPEALVRQALARCRRECRRITVADIIDRIPGGHPGAEEAWSMVASAIDDEKVTLVLTTPMREAFHKAADAFHYGGGIQSARMAFKEVYAQAVAGARARTVNPDWQVSLGTDAALREDALQRAVDRGLLTQEQVRGYLPAPLNQQNQVGEAVAGFLTLDKKDRKKGERALGKLYKLLHRKHRPAPGDGNNRGSE